MQITRLLPDAVGTTCGQRMEKVYGTEYSDILRVPFRTEKGIVRQWISRFEVWPYLETFTEVNFGFAVIHFYCSQVDLIFLFETKDGTLVSRMLQLKFLKSYRASLTLSLGTTVMETLLPLYWLINWGSLRFVLCFFSPIFSFLSSQANHVLSLQCTIAHALEKTKYPDSDIYWKKLEDKYHFSCQFTADLIAMNHTDFIITSTYQEIAGR